MSLDRDISLGPLPFVKYSYPMAKISLDVHLNTVNNWQLTHALYSLSLYNLRFQLLPTDGNPRYSRGMPLLCPMILQIRSKGLIIDTYN